MNAAALAWPSALSLGTALNPLNSSMIAVALVVLREDFGLDVATVTWVITAFYLTSAAGQPLMGRLADRFGPRRLFMLGMALVAVTCALAPFAPNFALLCVARAFMALGTATAYPSAVVMVGALASEANVKSTRPLGRIQMANTPRRRWARGGRPAGEPGGLAGAVPDQRPAGPGGDRWSVRRSPRRTVSGSAAGLRTWCGTRTCPASGPSSAPWCW